VTVNLNEGKGLAHTLASVSRQTYTGYEHVIIDGESGDKKPENQSLVKRGSSRNGGAYVKLSRREC